MTRFAILSAQVQPVRDVETVELGKCRWTHLGRGNLCALAVAALDAAETSNVGALTLPPGEDPRVREKGQDLTTLGADAVKYLHDVHR
jgi:hypothetical protein